MRGPRVPAARVPGPDVPGARMPGAKRHMPAARLPDAGVRRMCHKRARMSGMHMRAARPRMHMREHDAGADAGVRAVPHTRRSHAVRAVRVG